MLRSKPTTTAATCAERGAGGGAGEGGGAGPGARRASPAACSYAAPPALRARPPSLAAACFAGARDEPAGQARGGPRAHIWVLVQQLAGREVDGLAGVSRAADVGDALEVQLLLRG